MVEPPWDEDPTSMTSQDACTLAGVDNEHAVTGPQSRICQEQGSEENSVAF
jgi:hypothetical protein